MISVLPNLFRWLGIWLGIALLLSILISQDLTGTGGWLHNYGTISEHILLAFQHLSPVSYMIGELFLSKSGYFKDLIYGAGVFYVLKIHLFMQIFFCYICTNLVAH